MKYKPQTSDPQIRERHTDYGSQKPEARFYPDSHVIR